MAFIDVCLQKTVRARGDQPFSARFMTYLCFDRNVCCMVFDVNCPHMRIIYSSARRASAFWSFYILWIKKCTSRETLLLMHCLWSLLIYYERYNYRDFNKDYKCEIQSKHSHRCSACHRRRCRYYIYIYMVTAMLKHVLPIITCRPIFSALNWHCALVVKGLWHTLSLLFILKDIATLSCGPL